MRARRALPCSSQMVTAPNPTKIRLAERMKNGIALSLGLSLGPLLAASPAAAQALPVPTMVIPEASSKPGFDLGFSTGFDYVTGAKCSLKSKAVACPIPAGGCTIHHNRMMHYAGPNRSEIPRRAMILMFGVKPAQGGKRDFWWNLRASITSGAISLRRRANSALP